MNLKKGQKQGRDMKEPKKTTQHLQNAQSGLGMSVHCIGGHTLVSVLFVNCVVEASIHTKKNLCVKSTKMLMIYAIYINHQHPRGF